MAVGAVGRLRGRHRDRRARRSALLAAIAAGVLIAALFALLTLVLVANQVASGLALTLFGLGLSGADRRRLCRHRRASGSPSSTFPGLTRYPAVGPLLFGEDPLVYLACCLAIGVCVVPVPHARRPDPARGRRQPRLGPCARLSGASASASSRCSSAAAAPGWRGGYLSLVYTPQWTQNMTAGRGWIALALVVFGTLAAGAGGGRRATSSARSASCSCTRRRIGVGIPSQFLSTLPYLTTVVVLVLISRNRTLLRVNTPACLGQPFVPDR